MLKEDKLYKIWVYLQAEPLFWITLTLGAYLVVAANLKIILLGSKIERVEKRHCASNVVLS